MTSVLSAGCEPETELLPGAGALSWSPFRYPAATELISLRPAAAHPLLTFAVAVLACEAPLVTAADIHFPGRTVFALAYLLTIPGLPFAVLLRLPGRLVKAVTALTTSLAVQTLAAQGLLMAGTFSALGVQVVSSALGLALVALGAERNPSWPLRAQTVRSAARRLRLAPMVVQDPTFLGLVTALLLWGIAVVRMDAGRMGAQGLASVLNVEILAALCVLAVVAVRELRRERLREGWLAAVAVALVLILYGLSPAIESGATSPVSWLHAGFAQYIHDHGAVLHGFDARFSWPGFFALTSALTDTAGLSSAVPLLQWAPLVSELLLLLPLLLLARSLATSRRAAWLGVFAFACVNWYQQDYFSPQATTFLLYVGVLGILAWCLAEAAPEADDTQRTRLRAVLRRVGTQPRPVPGSTVGSRLALGFGLLLVIAAAVVSHQLTPVPLGVALLLFTFTGSTRYRGLWQALLVLFLAWFSYGATDFWAGHLSMVVGDVGKVSGTVNSAVVQRVHGDPAHLQMLYVRLLLSAVTVGAAVLGLWLSRRAPHRVLLGGLAFAPFGLIAVQSYGGEVVIRAFLFALPGLAVLCGDALAAVPVAGRRIRVGAVVLALILVVAPLWLLAARGANESFERVTANQYAAARVVHRLATPRTSVATFTWFTPLSYGDIDRLRYSTISNGDCPVIPGPTACAVAAAPDLLYLSTSDASYGELVLGLTPGWLQEVRDDLVRTGAYRVVYRNDDAVVLQRLGAGGG